MNDSPQPEPGQEAGGEPADEEELRRALEEEMRKVRMEDLLLQSVAGLLNLSARRIAKEDERDLEQARLGIDAVRAVVDLLGERADEVRSALSELQMLYARVAQGGETAGETAEKPKQPVGQAEGGQPPPSKPRGPGLWTPPGSTG